MLAACLLLAALATPAPPEENQAVEIAGRIVALEAGRLVLRTASGDLTLVLDARAELPRALAPGDEVRVAYRSEIGGDVVQRVVPVPTARVGPAETEVADETERTGDWIGTATVIAILALGAAGFFALERRARYRAGAGARRAERTNRSSQR